MKLQIKVDENGVISDVKFKTFGCGSAIASSSYMTERVRGLTLDAAGLIKNTEIAKELSYVGFTIVSPSDRFADNLLVFASLLFFLPPLFVTPPYYNLQPPTRQASLLHVGRRRYPIRHQGLPVQAYQGFFRQRRGRFDCKCFCRCFRLRV
jgi:hypothetical protein